MKQSIVISTIINQKVNSKRTKEVTSVLITMIHPPKHITKTITSDNGKEFSHHKQIIRISGYRLLLRPSIFFEEERIE